MPDKILPGPVADPCGIREAVCIHTKKIFDSCRDKDCIENLRFYPQAQYVDVINRALSVKGGSAQLLHVYVDVEPVNFNRGYYTVDMRFFYHVTLQVYLSAPTPVSVDGLCVFDKRVILFGSEGSAKIFSSQLCSGGPDPQQIGRTNCPIAVVEAVDPILLDARLVDACSKRDCDCDLCEIPACICKCFGGDLCNGPVERQVFVTLGQFSLVRLERETQLLIPVYDYCLPEKDCSCGINVPNEDPCCIFKNISFPMGEFFPPNTICPGETFPDSKGCSCGK